MEIFHSPLIIPLGGFVVAIVAIVSGIWSDAQNKRIRADQRMAMLARRMSIDDIERVLGQVREEDRPPKDPLRSLSNARRPRTVLVSSGISLIVFFKTLTIIVRERNVLAGAA